ncbi:translation initiation factor eIF-2B [Chlamydiota bacterium]
MEILNQIRDDYENGAGFLARRSCEILKEILMQQSREDIDAVKKVIKHFCHSLYNLRPSMTNINNLAFLLNDQLEDIFTVYSIGDPIPALLKKIDEIILIQKKAIIKAAHNLSNLLKESQTILTHSKSLSVLKALDLANEKNIRVYVTESSPVMEGRAMAETLNHWIKIPVFVIADTEISHVMPQVDIVIVGCDTILPDGSIINKIGTSTIALCAEKCEKKFYCVGDTYKISSDKNSVALEEVSSSQSLTSFADAKNVYFDKTTEELITGIVTEEGMMSLPLIKKHVSLWKSLERNLLKH